MAHQQEGFYDPIFAFAETTYTAQWGNTTTEIMTEIMMETKTEMTTTTPLPDQDPMVRSSIRSRRLTHALVSQRRIGRRRQRNCGRGALCIYALDYNVRYIYRKNAIVKMCHKLLYAKIGVLDLCCWNMKKNHHSWPDECHFRNWRNFLVQPLVLGPTVHTYVESH